jgi:nucleoside-diphosphate-sugar epimerase
MNEVFVTGGTGLLGRYVCQALIGQGFLPRLLVRTGSEGRIEPDVRERCRVTPGDLTVPEPVEEPEGVAKFLQCAREELQARS